MAGVPRSSLYPGLLGMGGYGLGKEQPLLSQAARAPGVVVERHWLSVALSGGRTRLPVEVTT